MGKNNMNYTKIANINDLQKIINDPISKENLTQLLLKAPLEVDEKSFQPYKVVNEIRYNLEAIQDWVHGLKCQPLSK